MKPSRPPLAYRQPALSQWKWRCFVLTVLYVGAVMFFGYITLSFVPRHEKLLKEMIGSKTNMPIYTQWVILVSRFMCSNVLILLAGSSMLLLLPVLLWLFRGDRTVSLFMVLLIALMVLFSVGAIPAMLLPLANLVESINRGS